MTLAHIFSEHVTCSDVQQLKCMLTECGAKSQKKTFENVDGCNSWERGRGNLKDRIWLGLLVWKY
jgi:hypothetical protein